MGTDDQIYQLAPKYFRLQPDVLQTICEHNMSFNDFAVHHSTATTNILTHCNVPTIRSMFRKCTFVNDYISAAHPTDNTSPSQSFSASHQSNNTYKHESQGSET